jgi:hypothetical protein
MMAWPEGQRTTQIVTGPRTGSAAVGGVSQPGTAPTARPRRAAEQTCRATPGHRCSPPPCPAPPLSLRGQM